MDLVNIVSRRLTNMRGVTTWIYITGVFILVHLHPELGGYGLWASAGVATAFLGVSGWKEQPPASLNQPTNPGANS